MLFFLLLFSIPIYGFCFWGIKDPEEVYVLFEDWRYRESPKLSDILVTLQRIGYVLFIIVWTIILIVVAMDTFAPDPDPPLPEFPDIMRVK